MQFNIIFRGDIAEGFLLAEVKQALARMFKSSVAKMEPLFEGRPVAIKKGLSEADALRYQKILASVGALTELVPVKVAGAEISGASNTAVDANTDAAAAVPVVSKVRAGESLAVRLAREEAESQRLEDLAKAESAAAGGLSLRPMEGELLDRSERVQVEPVVIDVSSLVLAELDGDILRPEEKPKAPTAPNLNIDFELAPVGSLLAGLESDAKTGGAGADLAGISLDD